MSSSPDRELDAQLRAVPLPAGLAARLRAVALADDEDLDAALRDVPLPEGLTARLRQVPFGDDEGLDAALRAVPVPGHLAAFWRRRAKRHERLLRMSRIAVAASLVIALTLTYFCLMFVLLPFGPGPDIAGQGKPLPPPVPVPEPLGSSWSGELAEEAPKAAPLVSPPEVDLAKIDAQHRPTNDTGLGRGLGMPPGSDALAWAGRPALPRDSLVYGTNLFDELPEAPKRPADMVVRGLDWPLVPGSNRAFLIRHGVHPFVSPADHPQLQTCPVPLGIETSSYELARRYLGAGERPPLDAVRTEEFLAAVDYQFPPPPANQALGLTVSAGPSLLGGEGLCLLQVGVQARRFADQKHAPTQLVLLVDTSGSMRWGGRIEIIRRGLRDLAKWLEPVDRVSLVEFNQAAHVLVEDVGLAEVKHFLAAVDSLSGEGSTDVATGLREAYLLTQQLATPDRPLPRVILLSDGLFELDRPWTERIEHRAAEAAARGISLDVIDLGQQKQSDPELVTFARAGHGTVHRATNVDQVCWALRELVTGRPQLVARVARLKVTFNPKTVLQYRLLGHEAKDWAGMMPGPLEAEFREGQSATALYELRLAATGPTSTAIAAAEVATAELSWYLPESGVPQADRSMKKLTWRVERKDVASALGGMPPSLQEAALVAETAEALRGSPFVLLRTPHASVPAALVRVAEMAGHVDSALYRRPSFVEFMTLVQQAIKAKPAHAHHR